MFDAIDGEGKEKRNFKEEWHGTTYIPSEEPIRSDVDELLDKPQSTFEDWYKRRKEVVDEELKKYEAIGSIPNLKFGPEKHKNDMASSITHLRQHIGFLRDARKYLEALKEKWEERHNRTIVV